MFVRALLVVCVLHASAIACDDSIHYIQPASRAVDVPLNAKLWLFDGPHSSLRIRGPDVDRPVLLMPFDRYTTTGDLGPLRPHTRYEVLESGRLLTSFTTGAAKDLMPPPPMLVHADYRSYLIESDDWAHTSRELDEGCTEFRAFDIAGNLSQPVVACVPVVKSLGPLHVPTRTIATALALAVLAALAVALGRVVRTPTS